MKIRKLELKDSKYMLEWMQDKEVVAFMGTDFSKKTIEDCKLFIKASQNENENVHFAIVDEKDEYMGTVSLKHIKKDESAEFAITVRRCAMGKGYSKWGMNEILQYGFRELALQRIIWCVSEKNERAVRFYNKNGYKIVKDVPNRIKEEYSDPLLLWYGVENPC